RGHASAAAEITVSSKARSLLVTHNPVTEGWRAAHSFVQPDVVNTGNAEAGIDAGAQQPFNYSLGTGHRGCSGDVGNRRHFFTPGGDVILGKRREANKCFVEKQEDGEPMCFAVPKDLELYAGAQLNLPHRQS